MNDAAKEVAWQPIEDAPRDGTPIFLLGGRPDTHHDEIPPPPVVVAWWDREISFECEGWRFCSYDSGYYGEWLDPVGWLPLSVLPPAPTPTTEAPASLRVG